MVTKKAVVPSPSLAPVSERPAQDWGPTRRIPKTAELVAGDIRNRIIRGELKEGDFLPPQGELLKRLQISRPTLREALRILEAEMFITIMRGSHSGARIHKPPTDTVGRHAGFALQAQGVTLRDVYEARLAIEPYAVMRLAEEHSPDTLASLRNEVERLRRLFKEGRGSEFMRGVARFHLILMELAGNRTLLMMAGALHDVVARHQAEFIERAHVTPDELQEFARSGLRSFEKTIALIESGDAKGAEAHWRLHIRNSNKSWLRGADETALDVLE
jgi:DNA-binding FadR family transcriptional regulator